MTTENPLAVAGAGKPKRVGAKKSADEWCAQFNGHLDEIGRRDFRWIVGGTPGNERPVAAWVTPPHIAAHPYKHPMDRRGEPMNREDTGILNHCLEQAGAKMRYLEDGSKYDPTEAPQ